MKHIHECWGSYNLSFLSCRQFEGETHQQALPEVCGPGPGDPLLGGEGEAERSGLLLLLRGAALHRADGGADRPLVSQNQTSNTPVSSHTHTRTQNQCHRHFSAHDTQMLVDLSPDVYLSDRLCVCVCLFAGWLQTTSPLRWEKCCSSSSPSAPWLPSSLEWVKALFYLLFWVFFSSWCYQVSETRWQVAAARPDVPTAVRSGRSNWLVSFLPIRDWDF